MGQRAPSFLIWPQFDHENFESFYPKHNNHSLEIDEEDEMRQCSEGKHDVCALFSIFRYWPSGEPTMFKSPLSRKLTTPDPQGIKSIGN